MAADRPALPVTDPPVTALPEVPLVPLDRDDEAMVRSWATTTALTYLGPVPSEGDIAWRRERTLGHRITVGVDDGQVVATFRSFDTSLTLPGTTQVDVNAVSGVTVLSTHRRRGLLSRWMDQELARAAASGQCASVLVASEAPIYGRFGYGPASSWCRWTIDARRARWRPDAPVARGSFRMVSGQEWAEIAPALHERVARRHPGAIGREQDLFRWIGGLVPDLSDENKGRRFLLHRDSDGAVDGAAVFSIGDGASWDDGATVKVGDLLAVDDVVERTIVGFLGDMDFITSVEVADQPASWSVPWGLVDTRAATSGPVRDALQVRLHDVPAALSAREYAVPGSVVLEVADPAGQAAGVYRLRVADDGTATCVRAEGEQVDVRLGVAALGSLWLGSTTPSPLALASSGQLTARSTTALARLHAVMAWPTPAHVLTHF